MRAIPLFDGRIVGREGKPDFGQDGPYGNRPGFDQIAQGMGGFMSVTGFPGQGPVRAGTAIADLSVGMFAALGIFTALWERETSGEGQWVQSSLLMSQIALMDFQAARSKYRVALNEEISKATVKRTTADWVETLNDAGVPCGPIYTVDQVFADPQVQHLGAAAPVQHSTLGTLKVVNQAVGLSRTPATMARATPDHGEHTAEILREIGYDDARIADLRARKVV